MVLVLGEVTIDQPVPDGPSGVAAVAIVLLPFSKRVCSTKGDWLGELSRESVIPFCGLAAKLSIASPTPVKQKTSATTMREWKKPE